MQPLHNSIFIWRGNQYTNTAIILVINYTISKVQKNVAPRVENSNQKLKDY